MNLIHTQVCAPRPLTPHQERELHQKWMERTALMRRQIVDFYNLWPVKTVILSHRSGRVDVVIEEPDFPPPILEAIARMRELMAEEARRLGLTLETPPH